MKYFCFLAVTLLLPFAVNAQSNYHEGYVVQNNGDTLKGYINYRNWEDNPKVIEFKTAIGDAKPVKYTSNALSGFEIYNMEKYISYIGAVSTDRTRFPDVPEQLDTTSRQDTVFLREVFKGSIASLYAYTDKIKDRYFVSEGESVPVELVFRQYYTYNKANLVVKDDYKRQLFALVSKKRVPDETLTYKLNKTTYNESDLIKIFKLINKDDVVPVKVSSRASGSWWYIGAGADRTVTTFVNQASRKVKYKSEGEFSPRIYGGFEVATNPNVQKLIFRGELSFSYTKPRLEMPTTAGKLFTYGFDQYMLTVTPSVIWNIYNTDKLKAFIGGGVNLNFTKYDNIKFQFIPQENWINFPFTTGVVLNKKIEIALTVTPPSTYSAYTYIYFQNQTSTLGVRYRFNKTRR